ncbi:MAG: hypothetical protein R2795_07240 [Saprospiraceae bacterium]
MLRAGIGEKRYFSEKAKVRGLAVGMSWQVGLNMGLVKPYYLEVYRVREGTSIPVVTDEKYTPENEEIFLGLTSVIIGASSFSKGLDELKVLPGLHARVAAHFDWGAFDEFVKALEAGVMVDAFMRDVPIMIESNLIPHAQNSPVLINLFLNLQLGKRM